jgi:hypothetical protein
MNDMSKIIEFINEINNKCKKVASLMDEAAAAYLREKADTEKKNS